MPLDFATRARFVPILRHEFGHWVSARALGFAGGGIVFKDDSAGATVDLAPSIQTLADAQTYIENRIIILLSGAMAETISKAKIDNKKVHALFKSTAANDHAKVREIVRLLTGMKYPGVTQTQFAGHLTRVDQELYSRAVDLVGTHASLIVDLAVFGTNLLEEAVDSGAVLTDVELPLTELNKFPDLDERLKLPKH